MQEQKDRERVHRADLHTCEVQAWLSSRYPTAKSWEGMGVKVQSTGLQIPLLNLALTKGYPIEMSEQAIMDEIETVKAFFADRNVPWYWWIGPDHYPNHLTSLLEQCGLVNDRPVLPAMAAELPVAIEEEHDSEIKVWLAENREDLEAASTIRHTAFRFPDGIGKDYFEAMASDWLAGDPARLYLASVGKGPPASIGAMIMGDGVPGVYVMATLPEWRRQGLGKAILSRILLDANKEGYEFIVLTASRIGYLLYQQFGFEHIFDYQIYKIGSSAKLTPSAIVILSVAKNLASALPNPLNVRGLGGRDPSLCSG